MTEEGGELVTILIIIVVAKRQTADSSRAPYLYFNYTET